MKRSPNLAMFVGWALRNFPQNFYVVESAHLTVIENGAKSQLSNLRNYANNKVAPVK